MKKAHMTIWLIIFFALTGCVSKQPDLAGGLVLINYYGNNEIRGTDSIYLDRTTLNDTLIYTYKLKTDTFAYSFKKSVENDSSIYLFGQNCPLVSRKTFKINNQNITILKYYYDKKSSNDEESSFFYHQDYGLLVGFNDGSFGLIFSMEYDNISKILADSIISDRTGFYLRNLPSPLPPIDSLIKIHK